jgi:hypothetical protein
MLKLIIPLLIFITSSTIAGLNLRGGVGYSQFAQRYVLFEDDTITASNEGKIFIEGNAGKSYGQPGGRANWMLSGGSSSFWGRTWGRWTVKSDNDFSMITQLSADLRRPYEDESAAGYFKGAGFLKLKKKWDNTKSAAKFAYENKAYSSESSYSYDYSLSKMRFDISLPLFGTDELTIAYQFAFRFAPDTVEANYIRNNFYATWDKFWNVNYLRADIEAERRVYNRGDLYGNFWRIDGTFEPRIALARKLTLVPKLAVEGYRYDWADEVHPNREQVTLSAGAEWMFSSYLNAEFAPKFLVSHAGEAVETDNFNEISLEFGIDWLRYNQVWLYANIEPGYRIYADEPPDEFAYFSDFFFVEGSAYCALWIVERLRFDVMISCSPEWHVIDDDDITTFYLSTNLRYEFFGD